MGCDEKKTHDNCDFSFSGDHLTRTKSMQPIVNNPMHSSEAKRQLCRAKSSVPRLVESASPSAAGSGIPPPPVAHMPPGPMHMPPAPSYDYAPPHNVWTPQPAPPGPVSHKKLQRQLTINPNYDPRIHHLQAQTAPGSPFNYPPPFLDQPGLDTQGSVGESNSKFKCTTYSTYL